MMEASGAAAGSSSGETSSSSEFTDMSGGSSAELTDASPVRESPLLAPGVSAEVRGLTSAPKYNGTACTVIGPVADLLEWDAGMEKWRVKLCSGAKATVAA